MILGFLLGLLAVIAAVAIVVLSVLSFKWVTDYIKKRIKEKENHRVVFADTKEVVDDYLKEKAEKDEGISMEELERMCEETPFVSAYLDKETGEYSGYEGFNSDKIDNSLQNLFKKEKGILITD